MKKIILTILFIVGIVGAAFAYFTSFAWYPGLTPHESAKILIHDRKFGFRALKRAMSYDDNEFLAELKSVSNNFEDLDNRNSFWVAKFLSSKNSTIAISTAQDLYAREDDLSFLVGAIALASNRQLDLNNLFQTDSKLLGYLKREKDSTLVELTLIALGNTKDLRAVPFIVDTLKGSKYYWIQAHSCDALGEIGGPDAELALEESLKKPTFYALSPAFLALVKLGNENAIPLAIDRVSPAIKDKNSGFIVDDLERVSGESFGYDRTAWKKWWSKKNGIQ